MLNKFRILFSIHRCHYIYNWLKIHPAQESSVTASLKNVCQFSANCPSKHDINGPFVVSVKATNGSMASHFLSQMARFSVAICLPFKACHEPAVNGPLKASHFTAI